MDDDFDAHYGLLAPEQTVLVRAYADDTDDQVLQEVKPRFIVMYEPNLEFIRRIEVCSARCSVSIKEGANVVLWCRCTETPTLASGCACTS